MARLEIIGKIKEIGNIVSIPTKNGQTFDKRDLVLDCSLYDRYTGDKRENFVKFEFGGTKCHVLDSFKVGDIVNVAFVLKGDYYTPKGETEQKLIMHIVGYDCTLHTNQSNQGQQGAIQEPQQALSGNAPTPPIDNVTEENKDDLPF